MDIPLWSMGWMELANMDGVAMISMALRVSLRYMVWWMGVWPSPLGLDKLDQESGGVESSSLGGKR